MKTVTLATLKIAEHYRFVEDVNERAWMFERHRQRTVWYRLLLAAGSSLRSFRSSGAPRVASTPPSTLRRVAASAGR